MLLRPYKRCSICAEIEGRGGRERERGGERGREGGSGAKCRVRREEWGSKFLYTVVVFFFKAAEMVMVVVEVEGMRERQKVAFPCALVFVNDR